METGRAENQVGLLRHPQDRRKKGSPILTWSAAPYGEHEIRREHWEPIKALAKVCMQRGELSKFSDRDALALEFWIGAATALRLARLESLADDVAKLGALEISTRGIRAVCELALF